MQQQAQQNAQAFLEDLATRVQNLEDQVGPEPLDMAFQHPATSLLLQDALLAAAVTEEPDKHRLLSELVAHRLAAGPEDRVTLAGTAACHVLSSLSGHHMRQLALLVTAHNYRPNWPTMVQTQEEYDGAVLDPTFRTSCQRGSGF